MKRGRGKGLRCITLIGVPPCRHGIREQEPHRTAATLVKLGHFVKPFSITWQHRYQDGEYHPGLYSGVATAKALDSAPREVPISIP